MAAKELYWEAGKELAEMVRSLYSRMPSLSSPVLVSKSGGVFRATELLWESLKEHTGDLSICWQEPAYEACGRSCDSGAGILEGEDRMKKITFIGAGSFDFTRELVRDILTYPAFRDARICLMDIDEERLLWSKRACEKLKAAWKLSRRDRGDNRQRKSAGRSGRCSNYSIDSRPGNFQDRCRNTGSLWGRYLCRGYTGAGGNFSISANGSGTVGDLPRY